MMPPSRNRAKARRAATVAQTPYVAGPKTRYRIAVVAIPPTARASHAPALAIAIPRRLRSWTSSALIGLSATVTSARPAAHPVDGAR